MSLLTHAEYLAIAGDLDNPATGAELTKISTANAKDVDLAVSKAREAFDQGHWSKMPPNARKEVLIKLCKYITRRRHELAVLESLESGKPIKVAPTGDDAISMIVREPIGVVAAILPWNFPMLMMAWKIGPALAAGCSVIVKPAEQTSMTALRIAELAHMAGVPRGVLQVLPGDGPSVGEPLGRHMDVDMVTVLGLCGGKQP